MRDGETKQENMNNVPNIGQLVRNDEQRDAIHIAVAPVVATQILAPGQHISVVPSTRPMHAHKEGTTVGIVDPFLKNPVQIGELFYIFLYPGTITSLKHDWTHPAFENLTEEQRAENRKIVDAPKKGRIDTRIEYSKNWIEELADTVGVTYGQLIAGAENYRFGGEYLIGGSEMEGYSTPPEFWDHYEVVTGITVDESEKGSFFSCSC